jgi:hypothetical protein
MSEVVREVHDIYSTLSKMYSHILASDGKYLGIPQGDV